MNKSINPLAALLQSKRAFAAVFALFALGTAAHAQTAAPAQPSEPMPYSAYTAAAAQSATGYVSDRPATVSASPRAAAPRQAAPRAQRDRAQIITGALNAQANRAAQAQSQPAVETTIVPRPTETTQVMPTAPVAPVMATALPSVESIRAAEAPRRQPTVRIRHVSSDTLSEYIADRETSVQDLFNRANDNSYTLEERRDYARQLQTQLGFTGADVDGIIGSKTRTAYRAHVNNANRATTSYMIQDASLNEGPATVGQNALFRLGNGNVQRRSAMGFRFPPFGRRDVGGQRRIMHYGDDIVTRGGRGSTAGKPIYTLQDGRVAYSGHNGSGGNTLVIMHPQIGLTSVWYHSARNNVRRGHTVSAGQQIAVAGSTGHSTGPHVHYESYVMCNGRLNAILPSVAASTIAQGRNFRDNATACQAVRDTQRHMPLANLSNEENDILGYTGMTRTQFARALNTNAFDVPYNIASVTTSSGYQPSRSSSAASSAASTAEFDRIRLETSRMNEFARASRMSNLPALPSATIDANDPAFFSSQNILSNMLNRAPN